MHIMILSFYKEPRKEKKNDIFFHFIFLLCQGRDIITCWLEKCTQLDILNHKTYINIYFKLMFYNVYYILLIEIFDFIIKK